MVRILERTVAQVEKTHNRVKLMSTLLFLAGLALLAAAAAAVLAGQQELWAVAVGGVGGLAALAAVFWSAPLDKIATSISDLVKLEVAFLGYIRVIGEIDSFFQMRYLDILAAPSNDEDKRALTNAILDTKNQMKDMMSHTVQLLDGYLSLPSASISELKRAHEEATRRIQKLEASASQAPPGG